ncbi:MAG: dienelactone hydrolase family protein [Rubrobacteraceae bacterium]|nr:dienelactone hydrolase family protein [Rubrobacteraceae bacterium]
MALPTTSACSPGQRLSPGARRSRALHVAGSGLTTAPTHGNITVGLAHNRRHSRHNTPRLARTKYVQVLWPGAVPVQVHYAAEDPWVEAEEVEALSDAVGLAGAAFEEHTYPGSGHLFADLDLPEYDRASSDAMWRHALAFIDRAAARS